MDPLAVPVTGAHLSKELNLIDEKSNSSNFVSVVYVPVKDPLSKSGRVAIMLD